MWQHVNQVFWLYFGRSLERPQASLKRFRKLILPIFTVPLKGEEGVVSWWLEDVLHPFELPWFLLFSSSISAVDLEVINGSKLKVWAFNGAFEVISRSLHNWVQGIPKGGVTSSHLLTLKTCSKLHENTHGSSRLHKKRFVYGSLSFFLRYLRENFPLKCLRKNLLHLHRGNKYNNLKFP
ncbi:hypothetical protein SLEP1_g19132 [Rubroshorea leprosula]|nr:hypothetical protein SLEP1_g19132 [Rubroshorea leprosula]